MVAAGDKTFAADLNALIPEWTSFTPTWGAATTNPALGNGSLIGWYTKVNKLVHVQINLTIGSTSTMGSGRWTFALPVAAAIQTILPAVAIDVSATTRYAVNAWVTTGTGVFSIATGGGANGVSSTVPFTWATDDALLIAGSYQSAT